MSEEVWTILLREDYSSGGEGSKQQTVSDQQSSRTQKEMADEAKKNAPAWANVGKLVGALAGVAGVIAFVFQMIRRSKIFSTFMDAFLTTISAFIDIMMIPLIPVFTWVLKFLVGLLPMIVEFSKVATEFFKDPVSAFKKIFDWLVDLPGNIASKIGSIFSSMGLTGLGKVFSDMGKIFGTAGNEIVPIFNKAVDDIIAIWGDSGLTFWDKVLGTAEVTFKSIGEASPIMWNAIKAVWNTVIAPGIVSLWSSFVEVTLTPTWIVFTSIVTNLWNALGKDISISWSNIMTVAGKLFSAVISDLGNNFKSLLIFLRDSFIVLLSDTLPRLATWFFTSFMPSMFLKAMEGILNTISFGLFKKVFGESTYDPGTELKNILQESKFPTLEFPGFEETAIVIKAISQIDIVSFDNFNAALKEAPTAWNNATQVMKDYKDELNLGKISLGEYHNKIKDVINSSFLLNDETSRTTQSIQNFARELNAAVATIKNTLTIFYQGFMIPPKAGPKIISDIIEGNYQTGTDYVPKDMLTYLHRGEKVVPASKNLSNTHNTTTKSLNINNVFNIGGNSPILPWQIMRAVDEEVKFNLIRIS